MSFLKILHSSRMYTARLLAVSPSMHCAGGVPAPGGVPALGGCLLGGCLVGGCGIPACTEADPPSLNRITHSCKNITFPQLRLRVVKILWAHNTVTLSSVM